MHDDFFLHDLETTLEDIAYNSEASQASYHKFVEQKHEHQFREALQHATKILHFAHEKARDLLELNKTSEKLHCIVHDFNLSEKYLDYLERNSHYVLLLNEEKFAHSKEILQQTFEKNQHRFLEKLHHAHLLECLRHLLSLTSQAIEKLLEQELLDNSQHKGFYESLKEKLAANSQQLALIIEELTKQEKHKKGYSILDLVFHAHPGFHFIDFSFHFNMFYTAVRSILEQPKLHLRPTHKPEPPMPLDEL